MNFMYSDANCFSKQLCACMEIHVREYQAIQEGKSDTLAICGTGVEGSHFTVVTTTCARLQTLPKAEKFMVHWKCWKR